MITSLALENIAIVDKARLTFEEGLTAITGETGSGKSLMIDAIALAFGAKISPKDILRQGQEKASVELSIDLPRRVLNNTHFASILTSAGIEISELAPEESDAELLISREFSLKASRSRLNGIPVSRETVAQLRPFLLDLHGQHELTNLFECDSQRDYLDSLGDVKFQALKKEVEQTYHNYLAVKQRLDHIQNQQADWHRQRDFLQYQVGELTDAKLTDDQEDARLQMDRQRLAHVGDIKNNLNEAGFWLNSDSPVMEGLQRLQKLLGGVSVHDARLEEFSDAASELYEEARQLASQLTRYEESVSDDPAALDEIVARLDQLERLKRKYGATLTDVFITYESLQSQLNEMVAAEHDQESLQASYDHLQQRMETLADQLTQARKALSKQLEKSLKNELVLLALPAVRFEILMEKTSFSSNGQDHITFMFSANPGDPVRPLAKVASGGELSRVLLALKIITATQDGVSTLVFDEIDTGISGSTAKTVSEKLFQLSRKVQVLVITHQPVIAAAADHHWHVEKTFKAKTVNVQVKPLEDEQSRLQVLSSLVDGTQTALDVAAQLRKSRSLWLASSVKA